jgi:hypothetical protein
MEEREREREREPSSTSVVGGGERERLLAGGAKPVFREGGRLLGPEPLCQGEGEGERWRSQVARVRERVSEGGRAGE